MKRKILWLGKLPPPYFGPAICMEVILNSTLRRHFELDHLDTRTNNDLSKIGRWSLKKLTANFSIYWGMVQKLQNTKHDLVVIPISQTAVGYFRDFIFIFLARCWRRKVLIYFLGGNFDQFFQNTSSLMRFLIRLSLSWTKGIVVLGKNLVSLFTPHFDRENIYVVPNGADYDMDSLDGRKEENNGEIQLIYAGNLRASKGFLDVLKAYIKLSESDAVKVKLQVIGTWQNESFRKTCEQLIESSGVVVTFHPPGIGHEEKLCAMLQSDIFVFTPRAPEGHPWVIVEALASGLPVVSTNQGAITESVIEGENGFIVEPQNPDSIAEKVKRLIEEPELRKMMAEKSRALYLQSFTEQAMVKNFTTCFNTVIDG